MSTQDLTQIRGFYPTPPTLVARMLERAGPWTGQERALEPSAGRGDIADRLKERARKVIVVEPHPMLAALLRSKGHDPRVCSFEQFEPDEAFDKILMNPPFAQGLDMLHVRRAFSMLAPNGTLVALMNAGDSEYDGTPQQRASFAVWLLDEPRIEQMQLERIDPELLLSPENLRKSHVPIRMLMLRKRGAAEG